MDDERYADQRSQDSATDAKVLKQRKEERIELGEENWKTGLIGKRKQQRVRHLGMHWPAISATGLTAPRSSTPVSARKYATVRYTTVRAFVAKHLTFHVTMWTRLFLVPPHYLDIEEITILSHSYR